MPDTDYDRIVKTLAREKARRLNNQLVPADLRVAVEAGGTPYDRFDMYWLADGAIAFLASDTATGNVALWTKTDTCASAIEHRVLYGPEGKDPR